MYTTTITIILINSDKTVPLQMVLLSRDFSDLSALVPLKWWIRSDCNPTFSWQTNFTLARRLISALIWDISDLWNRSDGWDHRKISGAVHSAAFLAVKKVESYCVHPNSFMCGRVHMTTVSLNDSRNETLSGGLETTIWLLKTSKSPLLGILAFLDDF